MEKSLKHPDAISITQDIASLEYNMDHKHRGVAVIFNHLIFNNRKKKRLGTDKDVEALLEALPLLGFESDNILVEDDLTKFEILNYSYKINAEKRSVFEDCDCIAIFILSHGSEGNKIYARDGDYDLYQLIDMYKPNNFKELAGKPKLFFVNACRGQNIDPDFQLDPQRQSASKNNTLDQHLDAGFPLYPQQESDSDDSLDNGDYQEVILYPLDADLLISMSSYHGSASLRRKKKGTWYIQDLCTVIRACANENKLDTTEITELLRRTLNLVSQRELSSKKIQRCGKKQTPNFNSTLYRSLYFKTKK